MKHLVIHCIIGPANSGKTTILNRMIAEGEQVVRVGVEMRKRYPPEHFQGKGSMLSTEPEVLEILLKGLVDGFKVSNRVYLDGNPRNPFQVAFVLAMCRYFGAQLRVTMLTAALDQLYERARKRSDDPDVVALALNRVTNDTRDIKEVMATLIDFGIKPEVIDTTNEQPTIGDINA